MDHMVVIGRGEGEILHNAGDVQRAEEQTQDKRYADKDTVMWLASSIARSNAELMRRLA